MPVTKDIAEAQRPVCDVGRCGRLHETRTQQSSYQGRADGDGDHVLKRNDLNAYAVHKAANLADHERSLAFRAA